MKIIVLDGYTLNPGDLDWRDISEMGDTVVYEHTSADIVAERILDADIVFTNKTVLNADILERAEKLKYIGVLATGYNVVDIACAKKKGIVVTNIPAYGTYSVAQTVFSMILHFTNHIKEQSDSVLGGDWVNSRDFCYYTAPLTELCGKTLGIIGLGRIGRQVAKIAEAFGMKILAYTHSMRGFPDYVTPSDLDNLLSESDFVSLHCPLTPETSGIINAKKLSEMKKTAILINTSRGPLIDDKALADALNNGVIGGAALDVLSAEPPKEDNPLLTAKNCVITPHTAWATFEARERLMSIAAQNLREFLNGNTVNEVL